MNSSSATIGLRRLGATSSAAGKGLNSSSCALDLWGLAPVLGRLPAPILFAMSNGRAGVGSDSDGDSVRRPASDRHRLRSRLPRKRALRSPDRCAARSTWLQRGSRLRPRRPVRSIGSSAMGGAPTSLSSTAASGSWCQLCLHDAHRTCRPPGGMAPSLTTYCVPQLGQVRIILQKSSSGTVRAS